MRWQSLFDQEVPGTDPQDPFPNQISFTQSLQIPYRHGHSYHETWNQGVAGPVFPPRPAPQTWVTRTGDTLNLFPPTYGDNAGREGYALTASEKSTVTRDGVQIGTQNQVFSQYTLPPAPGTYRVQLDYSRGAPFTLSTRTSIAWTFTSAHVTGDTPQPLPVSVVRFLPDLDLQNTAAGGVCVLPVRVDRQPDAARGHTSGLTVQVSYDDGAHWAPVPVLRHDDAALALLRHPAGHGFVSLRASAVDTAGNTVDEEIIRAYAF